MCKRRKRKERKQIIIREKRKIIHFSHNFLSRPFNLPIPLSFSFTCSLKYEKYFSSNMSPLEFSKYFFFSLSLKISLKRIFFLAHQYTGLNFSLLVCMIIFTKSPFFKKFFTFFFFCEIKEKKFTQNWNISEKTKKISDACIGLAMRTRSRRKSNYSTISTTNRHQLRMFCFKSGANWFEMQ